MPRELRIIIGNDRFEELDAAKQRKEMTWQEAIERGLGVDED